MASVGKLLLPPTVPTDSEPGSSWNQAQNIPNRDGELVEDLLRDATAPSSIFHGSQPQHPFDLKSYLAQPYSSYMHVPPSLSAQPQPPHSTNSFAPPLAAESTYTDPAQASRELASMLPLIDSDAMWGNAAMGLGCVV
jgi:hypothetical protein